MILDIWMQFSTIFISVEKIVHTTIEYKNLQCVRRIHAEQTFANRNDSPFVKLCFLQNDK